MIKEFFVCTILFVLTLNIETKSNGEDDDQLLAILKSQYRNFDREYPVEKEKSRSFSDLKASDKRNHKTGTQTTNNDPPADIVDPIRIAIFNDGDYEAQVKVNYVLNDKQREEEFSTTMKHGETESVFVPGKAMYIRIRVSFIGVIQDKDILDEQILNQLPSEGKCYLLAGTRSHPVYGLCPGTYLDMLKTWSA